MAIEFTEEQLRVIDTRNKNILVSAAAGSGKTAVLVERIIRRILSDENPVDIDRLLVVTFTNAAASSMRKKIRDALDKLHEREPDNEHIARQRTLINMAHITTIHSFCLSVIRDNFNRIDLEPSFRIGDEGELALMKEDALETVMDRAYEEADDAFMDFLSAYSLKRDDSDVKEKVLELYEFSRGRADSREWLKSLGDVYESGDKGIRGLKIYPDLLEAVRARLCLCRDFLNSALEVCALSVGPYFYADVISHEVEEFERILSLTDYDEIRQALENFSYGRLSSKKDESVETALREEAKSYRDAAKKETEKLRKSFFLHSQDKELECLKRAEAAARQLSKLALEFDAEFGSLKRDKNILDFSDIEHLALKIMKNGGAEEYKEYFEEIMTDEYQDSNSVQEEILTAVSRNDNYFCVGDVKQSIYGFRLAEPSIFTERYDRYENDDKSVRIDLKQNFRSRTEVLDAVNTVFEPLMTKRLGGVDYDERHKLNAGAVYAENGEEALSEFNYIESDPDEELSRAETEAYWVAGRISELVGHYMVSGDKGLRACEYGDIAILMRALSGRSEVFEKILTDMGIPVFTTSRSGYFQNDVIRKIVDFISVIDNPRQDIPLAAVLRSPFGGFSDLELAEIRAVKREGMLIDALEAAGEVADAGVVERAADAAAGKASAFLCKLNKYRELSSYLPIHDLIDRIIRENDYEAYAAAKGGASVANLRLLLKRASDFEATSYHGLFHFVRYIEKLKKYETDTASAAGTDSGNCVQLMSIHKSKGLEFPIVFLTGCEKKFNMQDTRGVMVIDSKLGAGLDAIDPERHLKSPTVIKNLIADKLVSRTKGEEMRVLYVAMTRAKEKLIMSGVFTDTQEERNKAKVSPELTDSYFDMIRYSLSKVGNGAEGSCILEKEVSFEDIVKTGTELSADRVISAEEIIKKAYQSPDTEKDFETAMKMKINFSDDHELINSIPLKAAVTRLKEHFREEDEGDLTVLIAEEEDKDSGNLKAQGRSSRQDPGAARRGTAYHKALEMVDINQITSSESAGEYLESLAETGKLLKEDAGRIEKRDIFNFARSGIAERMDRAKEAKALFKEQPFIFLCSADEVDESFPSEEKVLIQGIIDAFFIEDGDIVIVDYKTDRVREAGVLIERYTEQLKLYGKALEQITGLKVKQRIIYSVALNEEIEV